MATLLGVLFVACSEEENLSQTGKTGFLVSLAEDVKVESRSTPEEIGKPVASQFKLKITNQTTGSELYSGSYTEDLIPASAGMYEIEATYGDNPVLALDAPYYKGTAEADLADGESKTVQVNCKVANALASVVFDNSGTNTFESQFVSYGVRVSVNTSVTTLTNDGKSAYYRAGSMPVFTFVGTLRNGGGVKEVPLENSNLSSPSTFAAGKHCRITLKLSDAAPGLRVEISKVEVNSVTINETIPLEWLPKPKVTAEGFTDNTLSMYETETPTAKFNFNLSSALQELKFTLNFADETYQSLNKAYTLSELSEEDRTALTEAGVVLPAIGLKEASLDFTNLVAKFTGSTTGEALSNVIILDEVKANNRTLEGNQTYTIQTSAPDFNLVVYPGNTWTKQFTANTEITHGNADVIRKGMTFEYRLADSEEWISSPDSIIDGLPQDKEKETAYQVRGIFGKHYTEVVDAKTYPAIPLENGGLEGGDVTIGEDGAIGKDRGARYAWDGWATTNPLTTPSCTFLGTGYAYSFNSRSGVRPTVDKPLSSDGSEAVRIITTSYGMGGSYNDPKYFMHSELFLGTEPEEDNDNRTYGIQFSSRPKGLKFDYKCISNVGNDVSEVKIELYQNDILLGNKIFQTGAKADYERITLDIDYIQNIDKLKLEPNRLVIVFKSGIKENLTKNDLKKMFGANNPITGNMDTTADCMWRGNELFIDDVELVYD